MAETLQLPLTSLFPTLPLLLLLLLLILLNLKKNHQKSSLKLPPGPRSLPIIGNLHQLGTMPHLSLQRLSKLHGPIIHLTLGEIPTIIVSSARLAREVLRTHDLPLSSRPQIYSAFQLFYGCTDIVFSPYGPYWRQIRKLSIVELLSAKRVESYSIFRSAEVERLVQRIESRSGSVLNLTKALGLYANGVLCRAAFGKDFLEGGEYERHGFQRMLEEYQVLLGGFSLGDFFPSLEWINSVNGMKRRLKHTFKRFDALFDEIIRDHLKRREQMIRGSSNDDDDDDDEQDDKEKMNAKDLVDVLLDVQNGTGLEMPLTMDNIKAVILDMFAAGTDTTFITLDWGMTELIMNPRVMKKAQEEVRSRVGNRKFVLESDLPHLPYLKAVIKEIFRLHPPAPLLVPRESMEQVTIEGYQIPAKTRVFINAWAIGRDIESWENPEVFEPERFMNSSVDFKGQDFELIPFGAGRRGCPAITFGAVTIEIALAQLLHGFDWELPPGIAVEDLDMKEVFGITMHRIQELVVVAKPHFM
ncbi:Premnaspirodiene oxygenase protein [Dioscorea alata]|uniref:Premnaspirodiene oxygenase protein n=1 Tax=Dioscorea alata TaxID=55571 RepID=A0ACB7W2A4_DIOAL|nr:Premnaspirodiene oxygenase protein [Dioscorea alata]